MDKHKLSISDEDFEKLKITVDKMKNIDNFVETTVLANELKSTRRSLINCIKDLRLMIYYFNKVSYVIKSDIIKILNNKDMLVDRKKAALTASKKRQNKAKIDYYDKNKVYYDFEKHLDLSIDRSKINSLIFGLVGDTLVNISLIDPKNTKALNSNYITLRKIVNSIPPSKGKNELLKYYDLQSEFETDKFNTKIQKGMF